MLLLSCSVTNPSPPPPAPPPPPQHPIERRTLIISALFCAQGPWLACIWIYKHWLVNKGIYACVLCTPPCMPSMQHTVETVSPESSHSSLWWKKAADRAKPCYDLLISCAPIYPFLLLMCDLLDLDQRSWKQAFIGTSCSHRFTIEAQSQWDLFPRKQMHFSKVHLD